MSRDDLLAANREMVESVTREVADRSPDAIIIAVTNPLDAMCHVALERRGFPRQRVVGMAGILDSARFRTFLAWELGVSARDVTGFVLGGHGDTMVPITSYTNVAGVPGHARRSTPARLEEIVQRTRDGGAEVVKLLKSGSAYYAPRRRSRRWSTRSCSTRSACCRARPTATASTGSTACSSACR